MSSTAEAIMDAAEQRIRHGGYNGFSFRDIASDTGIKSASVHYHFPTKEALAAAVARRYTARFMALIDEKMTTGSAPLPLWRAAFRHALMEDGQLCLCGVLATTSHALPDSVTEEVRHFFEAGLARLTRAGLDRPQALHALATLEGAMMLASTLSRPAIFDDATAILS